MNTGTCLCGDITWEIGDEILMHVNCHCSICRKIHGSAYATFVATTKDHLHWIAGEDRIRVYASSDEGKRPFCPRCGSVVAAIIDTLAFMPAGNLEGSIHRPLDSHIFVADKAGWYEITDDAPQFDAYPPSHNVQPTEREPRAAESENAIGGSCDCGKIRYEFDGPAIRMGYCHCSRCRKARSAAYSSQAFVPIDTFRWLAGESRLRHFKLDGTRHFITTFCGSCSSPMPRAFDEFGVFMIPAGSLDQDPGIRPEAHIYVGSSASWYTIADGLPQFDERPPA